MKFKLDKFNYKSLPQLAETLRRSKAKRLEIEMTSKKEDFVCFSEVASYLYWVLDYELYFGVWLINFPFCIVNKNCYDHIINSSSYKGEKTEPCKLCKYFKICPGFPVGYFSKFGKNELVPINDLPTEIMIEVEPRCNFNCCFCYNHSSFARKSRNIKSFTTSYVKNIIDHVFTSKIKIIRFTGGEPMLRKDIFELLAYAKNKGLEVRLNTNASLINKRNFHKLKGVVDNVLIPIESWTDNKEFKITGFKNALTKKIKAIKLLKKLEIPVVRVGTVTTEENIYQLDKLADLILSLPIDEWELYRPISNETSKSSITKSAIKLLVNKIIKLRKQTEKAASIANALPFCSLSNLNKLNAISSGALFDDGHSRLVIDPRGFVKPHYFLEKNIGQPADILSAWNHPFMKKMRNLKFLPQKCENCWFRFKCRGGSRFEAKLHKGKLDSLDPLADYTNLKAE